MVCTLHCKAPAAGGSQHGLSTGSRHWYLLHMKHGLLLFALAAASAVAGQMTPFTPAEEAIEKRMSKLRQVSDSERGPETKRIAQEIEKLPPSDGKVLVAYGLANLSTEGDFGRDTLQEVTNALAKAVRERPQPDEHGGPNGAYLELAQLARYENMKVNLGDEHYKAAVAIVSAMHADQMKVDFTLHDITGKSWTRSDLKGKVVLVNFWATWCPPCRKEMPDLQTFSKEFASQGLVILAISDEDAKVVNPFISKQGYTFPVLLDPGRKVNKSYHVQGIPNSFIYDRNGRLVAQAIDMRTRGQFLKLLARAGIHPITP